MTNPERHLPNIPEANGVLAPCHLQTWTTQYREANIIHKTPNINVMNSLTVKKSIKTKSNYKKYPK